jgi:tRNA1Val (adenine37-N6)-methyltransferase
METTLGRLLGGRVVYAQPRVGFRSGIEPVLLAAAVPVRPGERVLEAGTGAGATLLCLGARVPDIDAVGVEQNAALAQLARANFRANGFAFSVIEGSISELGAELGRFHHACANPPWHESKSTPSPEHMRQEAKRAPPGLLAEWVKQLAVRLHPGGSLSLILPAARLAEAALALAAAACGGVMLFPLWPKPGRPAKLVLLQARKGARSPSRVLPGLVLHAEDGGYTEEAEAVLRSGAPLRLFAA